MTGKTNLADVQEALEQKTAMMHVLQPKGNVTGPSLGPVVTVELSVEGQQVKTLADTGSPVTIISIDCLLDILAKNRKAGPNKEEWKQEVEKKFLPPTLSINSFDGGEVNVISQLTTNWKRGTKEYHTTIQIQKGVPLDLLLGTDVLAELELYVLDGAGQGPVMELLQGKTWELRVDLLKSQLRVDAPT